MTDTIAAPAALQRRPSRAWRLAGLVLLCMLLTVPLVLIDGIASERSRYSQDAAWEIARGWGGPQTVAGPFLVVPVEGRRVTDMRNADGTVTQREETYLAEPAILMPERLEIDAEAGTEVRTRGIFDVPVYAAVHRIGFDFDVTRLEGVAGRGERLLWEKAELVIGISEPRALRGTLELSSGGTPLAFEPGTGLPGIEGVHAPVPDAAALGAMSLSLTLNGSGVLSFAPAGRQTSVRLAADWPHPSFSGAFLPTSREVGAEGFTAAWEIPHLARPVAQTVRGAGELSRLVSAAFGFALYQPVDLYQKSQRAAKYGILFIALTFCTVFLMEGFARRPTHVAQYALIGAAQCVFFLLLLSFAEQVGFGLAYVIATAATVALLTYYAISALGLGRKGLVLTGALGGLYGVMYLILMSEDQALLAGALLAFAAVAATMVATRNEDWGATMKLPKLIPDMAPPMRREP